MTKQFMRRVSLVVANESEALDLSDLHIEFEVRSQDLQTPNTANIRVWNPAQATVDRAMKEFSRVVLQVGHGDSAASNLGTIFDGTIIQARAGKASPANRYLDLVAGDGDIAYAYGVARVSLAAGATPADIAGAAIDAMGEHGVAAGYIPEHLGGNGLPRGVVLFGMARETLNEVTASTDTRWSVQNGRAQIIPNDGALPGVAVVLTAATGLIGLPEQTQEGIRARCLLNPMIKIGGAVQISNGSINRAAFQTSLQGGLANELLPRVAEDGFYRVLVANHVGDTRGQVWYSDLICIALNDGATQALVNRGLV